MYPKRSSKNLQIAPKGFWGAPAFLLWLPQNKKAEYAKPSNLSQKTTDRVGKTHVATRKSLFTRCFWKVRACTICSELKIFNQNIASKIVPNSTCVFYSVFDSCWTLSVTFWCRFGLLLGSRDVSGLPLGDLGRCLASTWRPWVQLGHLGPPS